ncbi:TVP38/TMEM64 family protein [Phaeobacter sp. JH72H1]|jgi:uncharacterized membrane protein YdjX (TVP38/TMEM64 family)|uniref:TVP38/TMEM64 family protein n=1 Tax=Phaeobacter sp. JH72H1 TaxID=1454816 RepID=UPI003A86C380
MKWRVLLFAMILVGTVALAFPDVFGIDNRLPSRAEIDRWIEAAGLAGPIVIVALMTLAIVASPLPSAPIALAAGAAYGHTFGTILVVLGAELGALIAFGLARSLGRPFVERHLGQKINTGLFGSQNMLTFLVFGSRLLPFLSFDMISYAAGLSKLHLWRFALATMAGIIPASFLLAHMGSQAMNGDTRTATWTALALGAFTGLSVLFAATRKTGRQRKES